MVIEVICKQLDISHQTDRLCAGFSLRAFETRPDTTLLYRNPSKFASKRFMVRFGRRNNVLLPLCSQGRAMDKELDISGES